jgi:hypothetical protein
MERDLSLGALTAGGMRATHTVPNLTREMGELQVAQSVLLPIDWPALSDNATTWLDAIRGDQRLIGFGSVHPYTRHVEEKLDRQIALGARGIKVHPAVQLVRPDDGRAMKLYKLCGERDIPVFWHCGPVDIEPPSGATSRRCATTRRPSPRTPAPPSCSATPARSRWTPPSATRSATPTCGWRSPRSPSPTSAASSKRPPPTA